MSAKYLNDGRVKYVDGATHWVNMDEPELANKYVRDFSE